MKNAFWGAFNVLAKKLTKYDRVGVVWVNGAKLPTKFEMVGFIYKFWIHVFLDFNTFIHVNEVVGL